MRVVYIGPLDAVEVPALGGTVIQRDTPTEVPDDIGKQLCKQECWRDAVKSRSKENN